VRWRSDTVRAPENAGLAGRALLMVMVAGWSGACAREAPPPGARPDSQPPHAVEFEPEPGSVVPGWSGSVKVRFNEPINARGVSNSIVGSPAQRYEVSIGRSQIRIKPDGKWLPGAVYYFTIPEGISDLLGNRLESPIEIVFSTGPELSGSVISGTIYDRVTGRAVREGRVVFLASVGDSVPYTAVTGTDGRFRLPETPFGEYRAFAFEDRNASLDLERRFEPYDSLLFTIDPDSSTVELAFRLTEPDTTPPVLLSVSVVDSTTLRLEFDDHLDPAQPLLASQVRVALEDGSEEWSVMALRIGEPLDARDERGAGAISDSAAARRDSAGAPPADSLALPADSLGLPADSLAGAPDSLGLPRDTLGARADSAGLPLRPVGLAPSDSLPSTTLSARLENALVDGRYRVTATGLRNLRELAGGGDTTFVYPAPDSLAEGAGGP
jgi:hypothetical protein